MQWWCSASGTAWTWAWTAYPGVWLVILALGFAYHRFTRGAPVESRRDVGLGWGGLVVLWLALDWPIGPLAAGYLASAHAFQFMMITMIAVPLLLVGVRTVARERIPQTGKGAAVLRLVTTPLVAAVFFNVVTIATHTSHVVDTLKVSQLGGFVFDLSWLVSALCFWWPVVVPVPERPRFNPLLQVLYLFLGTLFHTVIAIIMLMSRYPLYGVYELAPPMTGLTPLADLHVAGGIMELIGGAIIFSIMTYRFFRWANSCD